MFNGKIPLYIAIFHCYVSSPEGNNTDHVVSLIKISHEHPMSKAYTAQGSNMGCICLTPLHNDRNHFASTVLVGRQTIVTAANSKKGLGFGMQYQWYTVPLH